MASLFHTTLYFVLSLGILIAFHEFGHFWVARKLGVRVLRFSVGFGKPLWRYQKNPHSTEFVVAVIPLGGYVKMVDEREGEVAEEDLPFAFNRQSLPVRSAIVVAGPLFNLMLAVLIFWFAFMFGETGMKPVMGPVDAGSFAANAGLEQGDEIISVAGRKTPTWKLAIGRLLETVIDQSTASIEVKTPSGNLVNRQLVIPAEAAMDPDLLRDHLGIHPWEPHLVPEIDQIIEGGAAQQAGLKTADRIVSANDEPINSWHQWVTIVRKNPNRTINTVIDRDGVMVSMAITPKGTSSEEGEVGKIGASVMIPPDLFKNMTVEYQLGPLDALTEALDKTGTYSLLTLKMMGRMLIGEAALKNLSGPISIAQYAGKSAERGMIPFIQFIAIVSISLGVLNLLPIPVLDGGHLFFYLIEAIKGSPLSEKSQLIGQQIGIALLLSLMGLALFMDIERLFN